MGGVDSEEVELAGLGLVPRGEEEWFRLVGFAGRVEDAAAFEQIPDFGTRGICDNCVQSLVGFVELALESLRGELSPRSYRSRRLPNSASFAFQHVEGEAVLLQLDLDGIAASSGSACTTASLEPSHVLAAMRVPESYLRGSLRLTLGASNTMADVDALLDVLPPAVARIRALQPAAGRSG